MATITSTIKLVDQMTPTLNKISKAIDNVNNKAAKMSKSVGNASKQNNSAVAYWNKINNSITSATSKLRHFEQSMRRCGTSGNALVSAFRRLLTILGTIIGGRMLLQAADTMMTATARLNLINDGLYTTSEYMDMIYASAQRSRGSFSGMTAHVAKLGTLAGEAFGGSVPHMIAFSELLNKVFRISGSSATEASNATYQLTQALASGRLQGDELRSILENAPLLAQEVAKYLGVSVGELRKMASEGLVTSDVIIDALFGAADSIEQRFSELPRTLGDVWTSIKNNALYAFLPVVDRIQKFINSPIFERFEAKLNSIFTSIADAVIRVFDLFEKSSIRNALSDIIDAFSSIGDIAVDVGKFIADFTGTSIDSFDKLGQVIYSVIMITLAYKAIALAASAAVAVATAIQGAVAFVAALIAGDAWAWVILIIAALIIILYAAVDAWNESTGAAVSATGILFGALAFVVACVWDLILFVWDLFVTIIRGIDNMLKLFWIFIKDGIVFLTTVIYDLIAWITNILAATVVMFKETGNALRQTFIWIGAVIRVWALNIKEGMRQLCEQLPLYWEVFKLRTSAKFWGLVVSAGESFNSMLRGARDLAVKMLQPFEGLVNGIKDLFSKIAQWWNSLCDSLSFSTTVMGQKFGIDLTGWKIKTDFGTWSADGWVGAAPSINMNGAKSAAANATAAANAAASQVKDINWHTYESPSYGDYVDWKGVGEAIGEAFHTVGYDNPFDVFTDGEYKSWWDKTLSELKDIWNFDQYSNPMDAYNKWYERGESFENGVKGVADLVAGVVASLFGGDGSSSTIDPNSVLSAMDPDGRAQALNQNDKTLPKSLESLLGGGSYNPNDTLGAIADNTGSSAGSLSNIEDTMDLAEEELELLRKLAEQEVINRFTTAEIHVDMTNNNNVSSNMDLDGIVTHLSTKLYEELGVVASGVHY